MRRIRKSKSEGKDEKKKILIVDDQMENIRPFKMSFRKDFKVLTAMSGAEALEILERETVELLVSDHNMPGMTGIELLKVVDVKYPGLPKMLLTGNTDLEYLKNGVKDIHCSKIVLKPYDREVLLPLFCQLTTPVSHAA